jgi:integrase
MQRFVQSFAQQSQKPLGGFRRTSPALREVTPMRQPKPFFRKQTQSWYLQHKGKWINLGKDKKEAWSQYHALMAGQQEASPNVTVRELATVFFAWCQQHKASTTVHWYKRHINSFIDHVGERLKVRDVKPYDVDRWLTSKYQSSGDNNKNGAVRAISRLFNWASKIGLIPKNPIPKIERPAYQPREVYITPENWQRLIDAVQPGPFLDLLRFMRATGCRPFEARTVEARHFDGECIEFERSESKGKTHRRVIPLPQAALAIVKRLAAQYPEGPLFRSMSGKPWTEFTMNTIFDNWEKKLGFELFPYAVRHTFATDALTNGNDPITTATILGHRDCSMLMRVYSHLNKKGQHLRDAMEKAAPIENRVA